MHPPSLKTAVRRIRSLAGPVDATSDRDLLARFQKSCDDRAFAALVARHGPAVLGICRRILGDPHAAEDAFQATFFVLARRAGSVRNPAALGCWLHGVAVRVANKLKGKLARGPRSTGAIDVPAGSRDDVLWRDVRRVLDEELGRLPDRLRLPVFLCYFEGKTRDEAADALGWKVSTLRGRLEDGRLRLRTRLAIRGLELSAALLAVSAATDGLAVTESLLESTVRTAGGAASATVRSLASGIAMTGSVGKVKLTIGLLLLAIGIGTPFLGYRGEAGQTPSPGPAPKTAEPPPAKEKEPAKTELIKLMDAADRVWVVDAPSDENPVPEPIEVLKGLRPPDRKYSFRFNAEALKNLPEAGHRWVVFLRCVEETDRAQTMTALPGDKWFVPADDATLTALRQYVPPCQWGEASNGLRIGLHVRPDAGEPTVEVVLQNVGTKDLNILQFMVPNFDDWPHLSFAVTGPDGKTWRLERTGRGYKDSPPPGDRILKTGDRYIHPVRIGRWVQPTSLAQHGNAPPGLFAEGGDFKVEATYRLTDGRNEPRWWIGKLVSKPVTLTVPKPGPWGEAVDGVRARLRLPVTKYRPGDPLAFELDLKNEGTKTWHPLPVPFSCEVVVDGQRYTFHGDLDYKAATKELKPGGALVPFVAGATDEFWKARRAPPGGLVEDEKPPAEFAPLRLPPGKHQVRLAFPVDGDKVRPMSNPVDIEVEGVKLDDTTLAMALRADRIWVVPSPPVTARSNGPNEVLKGPPVDGRHGGLGELGRLPADDPKKRWIVFLLAEDEGNPTPEVKVWNWTNWSRPYTPELADTIREAFLPTEWGPETDGLKLGLRLRSAEVPAGNPVAVEVTIRNVGKVPKEVQQHRYHIYDYWPATRFEVTGPDGTKWLLVKPDGKMTEADSRTKITLQPGETYTHAMRLDRWPPTPSVYKDGVYPPNLFTKRGTYTIAARYSLKPDGTEATWTAALKSNEAKLTVKPEAKPDDWGEPSGGIRARVRLTKPKFRAGEPLQFEFDLKNTGDKTVEDGPIPMFCRIDLDGDEYRYTAPLGYPTSNQKIEPGKEFVPWVKVETNQWWTHVRGDRAVPLVLSLGKHTMRVSYPLPGNRLPKAPPVEFEVIADEPAAPDLPTLVARSDRIVVAGLDYSKTGHPGLKPKGILKGPNNRWGPEVQQLTVPAGFEQMLYDEAKNPEYIFFLRVDEDNVEVPKLTPAATRGWFQRSTNENIQAVLAALSPVKDAGPMKNGLSLALRPTASKVKLGDDIRLEAVLSNGTKDPIRVLQQRYNVYDYWPFLTFTVTDPDGRSMVLGKPTGEFKREDYIDDVELIGGGQYAHAVRLNNWIVRRQKDPIDDGQPKLTFRRRGKYTVTATYAAPVGFKNLKPGVAFDDWPFWNGELTSNTVTVEVTGPFDEVRGVPDGADQRLYVVLTAPKGGPADLADLVVRHAGHALEEANGRALHVKTIVFFIRTKAGDETGYISGFDPKQLEEIQAAKPDDAQRLAGMHAWSLGKLPAK